MLLRKNRMKKNMCINSYWSIFWENKGRVCKYLVINSYAKYALIKYE